MKELVAKKLRRDVAEEMANDGQVVFRRLLPAPNRSGALINDPLSARGMYLGLKRAYHAVRRTSVGVMTNAAKDLIFQVAAMTYAALEKFKSDPKNARRFKQLRARSRKAPSPRGSSAPSTDPVAHIANPLALILERCPPYESSTTPGLMLPNPTYRAARLAADKGRGDLVRKMAAQFVTS